MVFAWHLISIFFSMVTRGEPCTEYGCPGRPQYEPFVPAPPGHTPHCALPGQTFCETPDHYPRSPPDYNQGYDYPRQDDSLYTQLPLRGEPASVYGPPSNSSRYHSYKFSAIAPLQSQRDPFLPEVTLKYHRDVQRQVDRAYSQESVNVFGPNQSWLTNRYSRSDKIAPRGYSVNPFLGYAKLKGDRVKRQSNPEVIPLCPTRAQYIAPRAALNKEGNWMYVVNIPGQNKYSQLVRSEKCVNDMCNGICSIPEGYRSRCQQQFVQKRLVALEGSGNRLYTDLFWFPHGCTCQITPNF